MHTILVSRRYWPLVGGAEVVLRRLALNLAGQGDPVTVLTQRWTADLAPRETDDGVIIERLSVPQVRFLSTATYIRRVQRRLRELAAEPACLYVSMLKHSAYAAVGAGHQCNLPVVLRPECSGPPGDVHWQRTARWGQCIVKRCRQADALVAISPAIREELITAGYAAERIVEIPNGVPIPEPLDPGLRGEYRRQLNLPSNLPVAVFTGRLEKQKGLRHLLEATRLLRERGRPIRAVIVGDGSLRACLQAQASTLGLSDEVTFVGQSDQVNAYLRAADLFVLPSLEEGMSISLLEAMALGLPVVASDNDGNRRLVRDGDTGRLVPVADAGALADALVAAVDDPALAVARAARARTEIEANYSMEAMAQTHRQLFQRLLKERGWPVD